MWTGTRRSAGISLGNINQFKAYLLIVNGRYKAHAGNSVRKELKMNAIFTHETDSPIVELETRGKLTQVDFKNIVPRLEELIEEHGKISILLDVEQFEGWTIGGLWEDIKFDVKHFRDVERIALVGDDAHLESMAGFSKLFTKADIAPFRRSDVAAARNWLKQSC